MASPHKAMPRRLFEVLEEQQEPFILDACLLDHGFSERIVQSKDTFSCWRPRRKRGGGFWPGCLPTTKLGCWGGIKRALNWHGGAPRHGGWSVVSDCFAEARSTGRVGVGGGGGFHRLSCSGASAEWREYELSPVSVLDVHSDEDSSVHNHSMEEERRSSYNLDSATEVGMVSVPPLPSLEETSVALQEEFNCVWERQCGDLALVANLVRELENWSHSQLEQKREIGIEIEAFILEELREECVLDML